MALNCIKNGIRWYEVELFKTFTEANDKPPHIINGSFKFGAKLYTFCTHGLVNLGRIKGNFGKIPNF